MTGWGPLGADSAPLFFGNYWTNHPEIFHNYCLDLSEELLLCLGPKYPRLPEKIQNVRNFGNFRIQGEGNSLDRPHPIIGLIINIITWRNVKKFILKFSFVRKLLNQTVEYMKNTAKIRKIKMR